MQEQAHQSWELIYTDQRLQKELGNLVCHVYFNLLVSIGPLEIPGSTLYYLHTQMGNLRLHDVKIFIG